MLTTSESLMLDVAVIDFVLHVFFTEIQTECVVHAKFEVRSNFQQPAELVLFPKFRVKRMQRFEGEL